MSDQITRRRATRRSAASEAGLRKTGVAGSDMYKPTGARMDEFGAGPFPSYYLDFRKGTLQPQIGAVAPTVVRAGNTATRTNESGVIGIVNANLPRFDTDRNTMQPLGLLVEEARTNNMLQSSDINNAATTKSEVTLPSAIASLDAGVTGHKVVPSTNSAEHFIRQEPTLTASVPITISVYFKSGGYDIIRLRILDHTDTSAGFFGSFSALTGLSVGSVAGAGTLGQVSMTNVGGGWWRAAVSGIAKAGSTQVYADYHIINGSNLGGSSSYAGDGTSGVYVWGLQLETGGFVTSYIPTAAAAVNRAADVVSVATSNIPSFSNVTLGMVCKASCPTLPVTGEWRPMVTLNDGDSDDYFSIIFGDATDCAVESIVAASGDGVYPTRGSRLDIRIAGSWIVGNVNGSQNGKDEGYTYNAPSLPTVNTMHIGHLPASGSDWLNGHVQYIQYFPRTFTTAELQALSQ